jgi:hypothetical protein
MARLPLFLFFAAAALAQPNLRQYGVGAPLIQNKPVSIEFSSETVQTLADGNRITRKYTTKQFRDSQGRVRRESGIGSSDEHLWNVTVQDPVAHLYLAWNTRDEIVTRTVLPGVVNLTPDPPKVRLLPVAVAQSRTEQLGTRIIQGFECQGTRHTMLLPPGHSGNERAIETINESWYSRDLNLTLEMTSSDPRIGATSSRVTKIDRAEPAAALFAAPEGYKVAVLDLRDLPLEGLVKKP